VGVSGGRQVEQLLLALFFNSLHGNTLGGIGVALAGGWLYGIFSS
jgi:hypothetical protein